MRLPTSSTGYGGMVRNTQARPRIPIKLLIGLVIAAFAIGRYMLSASSNPVTGATQHIAMSQEQETALGLQSVPQMAQQMGGLSRDQRATELVRRVGSNIVGAFPRDVAEFAKYYKFDFHLLGDRQTVNAFALPGGQIFITEALLGRLQTEGQLAGVLGHEVGHVLGRHGAQQMAKGQLTQGLVGAATVAGSDVGGGQGAGQIAQMVGNFLMLKYGRNDELQADELGLQLMSGAGYDPRALIGVMKILEQASGGSDRPEFSSTHPNPGHRIEVIKQRLGEMFPEGVPTDLKP